MAEQDYLIRLAAKEDCAEIAILVKALLADLQLPSASRTPAQLREDGFPSRGPPAFTCHVAERRDAPGRLVGICFHYVTYSARHGRCAFLENLYVTPACRGAGLGARLMAALADWALSNGCCRIDYLTAPANEPQRRFYARFGPVSLAEAGWHQYRILGDALRRLAGRDGEDGGTDGGRSGQ